MKTIDFSALTKSALKNKYVLIVLAVGIFLMLLPTSHSSASENGPGVGDNLAASGIPLDTESQRLSELLSQMSGVGRAEVLLSAEGAVVLCDGADSARVKLAVTNALTSYTGLRSDKISVMKMK